MKKWLIFLLVIPSLCTAATTPPWQIFAGPRDNWVSGKTMARLAVPHGWLVHSRDGGGEGATSPATTFIPDENHEWVLEPSLTQTFTKPK